MKARIVEFAYCLLFGFLLSAQSISTASSTREDNASPFDFHYKQDACNPLSVQFFSDGTNIVSAWWSFGDGSTTTGNLNPVHTYAAYGTYTVQFGAQVGNTRDTITKIIRVNVSSGNVILTPDTTICVNTTPQLRTAPGLSFCWSPATYLDDPNGSNPTTSTPNKMIYYCTAEVPGNNLVINGDFDKGNTGFTSGYTYATPGFMEGTYFTGKNPSDWHPNFPSCADHTTGNGNMMMVNGALQSNVKIWSEIISVTPNTSYAFSAWLQAFGPLNPAMLQFSINGIVIGDIFHVNSARCVWDQFHATWNSGNNTTATLSIINQNTSLAGNDFALDDISFAPVTMQRDSVVISVDTPLVKTINDTTVCKNSPFPLQATGASTWLWSPAAGLSNAAVSNPVATLTDHTEYIVTGTDIYGCTAKDTVDISLFPVPVILTDHDLLICPNTSVHLLANSALLSYVWTPGGTLNNPIIANPVATPAKNTMYTVQVTDANNCTYVDSVDVRIRSIQFTASQDQAICRGSSIGLKAAGGDSYQWQPAGSLNDAAIANPVATPDTTTEYNVHIGENTCGTDTTINLRVVVNPPPVVTAQKTNDINCTSPNAKLSAGGALSYVWFPATGLDNPNIYNPTSGTDTTTTYFVKGTNQYGCSDTAAITVYVTAKGKVTFVVPNAFTPNGDGHNDCFGVKSWGSAVIEEFSVFTRWGERVFTSGNPNQCWNGRYKGKPMEAGGYAYIIIAKTICGTIKRTGMVMLIR